MVNDMVYKIIIDNSDTNCSLDSLYSTHDMWKDYVCENFDDNVVICGNKDFLSVQEASWWVKTIDLINDIDCDYTKEDKQQFLSDYEDDYEYNESTLKKIWDIY